MFFFFFFSFLLEEGMQTGVELGKRVILDLHSDAPSVCGVSGQLYTALGSLEWEGGVLGAIVV